MNVESVLGNLPAWTHAEIDTNTLMRELNGPHIAADMPRLYQVEVTTRCGLRCGFCPRQAWPKARPRPTGWRRHVWMVLSLLDSMPVQVN